MARACKEGYNLDVDVDSVSEYAPSHPLPQAQHCKLNCVAQLYATSQQWKEQALVALCTAEPHWAALHIT